MAAPAAAAAPRGIELSGPLSAEDQEFIGEHLAEGRVFRKYGLGDKARDQFEAVLTRFPDNTEALQELADLLREKGDGPGASRRLRVLAEVLRLKGDAARAARTDEEADALAGPAAAAPAAAAPVPPAPAPAAPAPALVAPAPAEALASYVPAAFEPAPSAAAFAAAPSVAAAPAAQAPAESGLEVDIDVEDEAPVEDELAFDLEPVSESADDHPQRFDESELGPPGGEIGGHFIDEEAPAPDGFDLSEAPEAAGESTAPFPSAAAQAPVEPPSAVAAAPAQLVVPAAPPAAPPAGVPQELRRALDEIDSLVALGFVGDAQRVIDEVPPRFAGHPALLQRLAELGLAAQRPAAGPEAEPAGDDFVLVDDAPAEAAAPGPAAIDEPLQLSADFLGFGASPAEPEPAAPLGAREEPSATASLPDEPAGGFDLSSELGDLFGAQSAVSGEEAVATGTDLGDARSRTSSASSRRASTSSSARKTTRRATTSASPTRRWASSTRRSPSSSSRRRTTPACSSARACSGICFLEKGMPKLAVKWFEKGLQAPGRSEEEYQALRYDLANALEQAGEVERAGELFTELYGQDSRSATCPTG